jgi:hypothetical protein
MAVKYNVSVEALRYYVKNDLRKDNDGWKILD